MRRALQLSRQVNAVSCLFRAALLTFIIALSLGLSAPSARAFSLLGPYTDWMVFTNGYQQHDDIGGPMDITEGYRWNMPFVTYGFDTSFLDYFGSNGVAAVESAIQVFNDVRPSSELIITIYPVFAQRRNWTAESLGLCDLKTATMCALIEQIGLAQPSRYVFSLRRWSQAFQTWPWFSSEVDWGTWAIPDYILQRNFDPGTLLPSHYVNGVLYSGYVVWQTNGPNWVQTNPIDSEANAYTAVAEGLGGYSPYGAILDSLTQDDVGGIRFLLSRTNIAYENLLPDVHGSGTNTGNYVDGAWRGGVEKIMFVRQSYDATTSRFLPMTNQFADSYFTNGTVVQQSLERVTTQPDFLFSADDHGQIVWIRSVFTRTGTSNWINNAVLNGHPGAAGPGIIRPQVRIAFQKLGPSVFTQESGSTITSVQYPTAWGSFDLSTNAPILYPMGATNILNTSVRLGIDDANHKRLATYLWSIPFTNGQSLAVQTSTNLADWSTCTVITNLGTVTDWSHTGTSQIQRFFRVTPQ